MTLAAGISLRFAQPWWLLALLAAGVPILLAVRGRRRGWSIPIASVALQVLAVGLLACALAGPRAPLGPGARKPLLVLTDASESVRGQEAAPWPDDLPAERRHFAASIAPPGAMRDASATRLTPALQLARARADELAGVVLRTDGQFQDDWAAAARALGATGLPVAIVPMTAPGDDARVAACTAEREPGGESPGVRLRATVTASADTVRQLSLRRMRPGERIFPPRRVELAAGESATIRLTDTDAPAGEPALYEARLLGRDAFAENDALQALALPESRRVAWVARDGYERPGLAERLRPHAALDPLPPADAPREATGWAGYAAVVLVDAEGLLLDAEQRAALAGYVRDGGGLLQVGTGPHRSPADREDALNRIAALAARPYERTPLKVVVALDASGSMSRPAAGAAERFSLAAQAVLALEDHLTPRDALAVVTFAGKPWVRYDSGGGRPDFAAVQDALRQVRPAGPTRVLPALRKAADSASGNERETLVILLSDLLDEGFDPEEAAALFGPKTHLAVVVAGPAEEPRQAPLRQLAARVEAPLRTADDLGQLGDLFVEFLQRLRGDPLRRGSFPVEAADGSGLTDPAEALSPLAAYIVSKPHEEADVLLRVLPAGAAGAGEPLLARRRAVLGACTSLAVPLRELEATGDGLNALLSGELRRVLRPPRRPGFSGRARDEGERVRVRIRAVKPGRLPEQWPRDGLELLATLAGAEGEPPVEQPLRQTAPGVYEAELPAPAGPAAVKVRERGAEGPIVWRGTLERAYAAEFAAIGPNRESLRRLADLTGGRITPPEEMASLSREWAAERYRPIAAYVLATALAMMLAEWALTRVRRSATRASR